MPISSLDSLISAMAGNQGAPARRLAISKATIATNTAGLPMSKWRATGTPTQGAIPAAAAICNRNTTGGLVLPNPGAGRRQYASALSLTAAAASTVVELHDRLGHMGGLSGASTSPQSVGLDISGAGDNLPQRRGDAAYSEVNWWLEIYTAVGSTAVNYTVTYTRGDGTPGRTTAHFDRLGGTGYLAAGRLLPILSDTGESIRAVTSITLAASTLTAGSFGVTATRPLFSIASLTANAGRDFDYAALGLPEIHTDACLFPIVYSTAASTGAITATLSVIEA